MKPKIKYSSADPHALMVAVLLILSAIICYKSSTVFVQATSSTTEDLRLECQKTMSESQLFRSICNFLLPTQLQPGAPSRETRSVGSGFDLRNELYGSRADGGSINPLVTKFIDGIDMNSLMMLGGEDLAVNHGTASGPWSSQFINGDDVNTSRWQPMRGKRRFR